MPKILNNKCIFITGSGGLLGNVYIDTFLKNGAEVIASDIPGSRAKTLINKFKKYDGFHFYSLDVSSEKQIINVFKKFQNNGHKPNVFINNAAITGELLLGRGKEFPDFANTLLKDWEKTMKVNLIGPFMIARQMDREIVGKYPCKLINISSMYALRSPHHSIYKNMPFNSFSAYSASKAGIHGLTLWLASYWASRSCTVNTLAPGAVFNNHSKEFQKRVSQLIMKGRMAKPQEIADVMLFLCSNHSRYLTGQIINADGGFSSW